MESVRQMSGRLFGTETNEEEAIGEIDCCPRMSWETASTHPPRHLAAVTDSRLVAAAVCCRRRRRDRPTDRPTERPTDRSIDRPLGAPGMPGGCPPPAQRLKGFGICFAAGFVLSLLRSDCLRL